MAARVGVSNWTVLQVWRRAGLKPHVLGTDVKSQADVLAAITKERRVELALEGDRWPDLVRQGLASTVKTLARPGYVLFPIPIRDINPRADTHLLVLPARHVPTSCT